MSEYYFFPPKAPQFYFPKKEFKAFYKYYTPYSLKARAFWFLYKNSSIVRVFFKIKEEDIPLPISEIKKIINLKDATYFYNLGTRGIEQKATIVAKNKKQQYFLKFAQKERAKKLVENEIKTLLELKKQTAFKTAIVFESNINKNYAYLLTEVIRGVKVNFTTLNASVSQLLLVLAKRETKEANFEEVFAHGDFCPWNMLLIKNKELVLIDWEMAGYKILGYDLFTYIFQTNFLLYPTKSIQVIFLENQVYISKYFNVFQIVNWKEYLIKFVSIKIVEEKQKEDSSLLSKYQELLNYDEYNH